MQGFPMISHHIRDYWVDNFQNPSKCPHIPIPNHLQKPYTQLTELLRSSKRQHSSSSIFVFGGAGGGREQVIDRAVVAEFVHEPKVARIHGLLCDDEDAIFSIASQLCVRNDRIFGSALQDIVTQMKIAGARPHGDPVVIIIEDIQQFAKSRKQVLIYTLLDLMHKPDLLFVLIGTTSNVFVGNVYEKRIVSRLNAQYIFLPRPCVDDILFDIHQRLHLPDAMPWRSTIDNDTAVAAYDVFRQQHLRAIEQMFGKPSILLSSAMNDDQDNQVNLYNDDNNKVNAMVMEGSCSLRIEIAQRVSYGFVLDHFYKAMTAALLSLPWTSYDDETSMIEDRLLTHELVMRCLYHMEPRPLHQLLRSLPLIELQIIAAITHMDLKTNSSSSSKKMKLTIADLKKHFERLVNQASYKDMDVFFLHLFSLQRKNLITITSNAPSIKNITDSDLIHALHPARFIQRVFAAQDEDVMLVIAPRIRDAILNPQAPIITTKLS